MLHSDPEWDRAMGAAVSATMVAFGAAMGVQVGRVWYWRPVLTIGGWTLRVRKRVR